MLLRDSWFESTSENVQTYTNQVYDRCVTMDKNLQLDNVSNLKITKNPWGLKEYVQFLKKI